MRLMAVILGGVLVSGCVPYVKVPYFGELRTRDVCGEFSSHCQPTSSALWELTPAIDYSGDPTHFLGRRMVTIFERERCGSEPSGPDDTRTYGNSGFTGTVTNSESALLQAELGGNLKEFINRTFTSLPADLKAHLETEAMESVEDSIQSEIDLSYKRIVLSQPFMDTRLGSCLDSAPAGAEIITGISVITIEGDWTSKRIEAASADLEATVAYNALSAGAKADYERARDVAIRGEYDPLSYVFAVAYRRKDG